MKIAFRVFLLTALLGAVGVSSRAYAVIPASGVLACEDLFRSIGDGPIGRTVLTAEAERKFDDDFFSMLSQSERAEYAKLNFRNNMGFAALQADLNRKNGDFTQLDSRRIDRLVSEVQKQIEMLGFKTHVDPAEPMLIRIDQLPTGHPLTSLFERSQTTSLKVRYVFDVWANIREPGTRGALTDHNDIFVRSLLTGTFSRQTTLHELGHRSDELLAQTQPLSPVHSKFTIYGADNKTFEENVRRVGQILKLPPQGYYLKELRGDELNQWEKDVRRLYSKSADRMVIRTEDLPTERKNRRLGAQMIAEAILGQSEYALKKIEGLSSYPADGANPVARIVIGNGIESWGVLEYNLAAFKLPNASEKDAARVHAQAYVALKSLLEYNVMRAKGLLRYLATLPPIE